MNTLTAFIREHQESIINEWLARAATLPSGQALAPLTLRDHIPTILTKLADAIDRRDETAQPLDNVPARHATTRFRDGYDLRQVVAEYRMLREVIMEMYTDRGDFSVESRPKMKPLTVMHEAVDRAIGDAVDQYAIERDSVRETFIAMLGHDLREPLNAIVFSGSTLSERGDDVHVRSQAIARIATNANRMERMIRDLLDFTRTRLGGGFVVVPAPFDARALIEETVRDIAQAHPTRTIRCSVPAGDFQVEWDADRVAQVITNLVGNALTHGRDPVVVDAGNEGDRVTMSVRNSGEIPAEALPRLFDAFARDGKDPSKQGLGLGLYIVQQVARAHGGDVTASSSDDRTMIRVTLPRRARRVV